MIRGQQAEDGVEVLGQCWYELCDVCVTFDVNVFLIMMIRVF